MSAASAPSSAARGPFRVLTSSRGCRCCRGSPPCAKETFPTEAQLRTRIAQGLMEENGDGWWETDAEKLKRREAQVEQIHSGTATLEQALRWMQQALAEDGQSRPAGMVAHGITGNASYCADVRRGVCRPWPACQLRGRPRPTRSTSPRGSA